jgi:hypothetical protein
MLAAGVQVPGALEFLQRRFHDVLELLIVAALPDEPVVELRD